METFTEDFFYLIMAIVFMIVRGIFNQQDTPPTQEPIRTEEPREAQKARRSNQPLGGTIGNILQASADKDTSGRPSSQLPYSREKINRVGKQEQRLKKYSPWQQAVITKEILQPYAYKV